MANQICIIPNPGKDEYLVKITTTIDGLELAQAKNKIQYLKVIIANIICSGLIEQVLGHIALARLIPKDSRRVLIETYLKKCNQQHHLATVGEVEQYLKEHGVEP